MKFESRLCIIVFIITALMSVIAYRSLLMLSSQIFTYQGFAMATTLEAPNKTSQYLTVSDDGDLRVGSNVKSGTSPSSSYKLQLAVVVCGEGRINESLTMVKSALLFTRQPLFLHLFTDPELYDNITQVLSKWKKQAKVPFDFEIYDVEFPSSFGQQWRNLFKTCAAQRLFFPDMLKDVDSLLYVDTDTLFFRPLDHIWSFFKRMNSSHIAALTPEHEDPSIGWYNRFARHPFYGKLGVNSGVMLMNLTKMRSSNWVENVTAHFLKYKLNLTWGDQDIINIIFHFSPEMLYVYGCEWNFRPDHCMYKLICDTAVRNGVSLLHGSRGVFHNNKQASFKGIYNAFTTFDLEDDLETGLLHQVEKAVAMVMTNCGKLISATLLKRLRKSVTDRKSQS